MPVRGKGTTTTKSVGEAAQGEPIHVPSKPPAEHRSVADRLDHLVDSLKLRERLQERATAEVKQRVRAARAAGHTAAEAATIRVEPLPPYTIERPSPGLTRITLNLPAGGSIAGEGRNANTALANLVEKYGPLLESEGMPSATKAVAALRKGSGKDAWDRPVGANSLAKPFSEPDDDDDAEDGR